MQVSNILTTVIITIILIGIYSIFNNIIVEYQYNSLVEQLGLSKAIVISMDNNNNK